MRPSWVARHRKTLTIAGLGVLQVAAYIVADPRNVPPWVVTLAAAVNTAGVYWVKNDQPPRSRQDLAEHVPPPTRAARPEDRRRFYGS